MVWRRLQGHVGQRISLRMSRYPVPGSPQPATSYGVDLVIAHALDSEATGQTRRYRAVLARKLQVCSYALLYCASAVAPSQPWY
eukprot:157605-Rhodomonas_salina.1